MLDIVGSSFEHACWWLASSCVWPDFDFWCWPPSRSECCKTRLALVWTCSKCGIVALTCSHSYLCFRNWFWSVNLRLFLWLSGIIGSAWDYLDSCLDLHCCIKFKAGRNQCHFKHIQFFWTLWRLMIWIALDPTPIKPAVADGLPIPIGLSSY